MPATTIPPERGDDSKSVEELILELSECALASECGIYRPDAIDEIIMMCRAYIVSIEGRTFFNRLFNRRRH